MIDLSKNAFHILGVSPQTSKKDIVLSCEKAIIEGLFSEKDLLSAKDTLLHPKKRLDEELTCLWGVSAKQISSLIRNLDQLTSTSTCFTEKTNNHLPILAHSNYTAHLCSINFDNNNHNNVNKLILAQEELSKFDFQYEINKARKSAGLPKVNPEHLREALSLLNLKYINSAINSIINAEDPGRSMIIIVVQWRNNKTRSSDFTKELVRKYDRWTIPKLSRIEKDIENYDKLLRENPKSEYAIQPIEKLLDEWDRYSQPVQLLEESKGLDEIRSSKICQNLRKLSIFLANEHKQYTSALKISKAILKTFPELPSVMDQLPSDIKHLEKFSIFNLLEKFSIFKEFRSILDEIDENPQQFALNLVSSNKWTNVALRLQQFMEEHLPESEYLLLDLRPVVIKLLTNSHYLAAITLLEKIIYWCERFNVSHNIHYMFIEDFKTVKR